MAAADDDDEGGSFSRAASRARSRNTRSLFKSTSSFSPPRVAGAGGTARDHGIERVRSQDDILSEVGDGQGRCEVAG